MTKFEMYNLLLSLEFVCVENRVYSKDVETLFDQCYVKVGGGASHHEIAPLVFQIVNALTERYWTGSDVICNSAIRRSSKP